MADEFLGLGYDLVTGGTDNHMMLLDFSKEEFDGGEVEKVLDKVGISVSKSLVPNDLRPAFAPSGLRIGMPAMTTRGVKEQDTVQIVNFIDQAIKNRKNLLRSSHFHLSIQVEDYKNLLPLTAKKRRPFTRMSFS